MRHDAIIIGGSFAGLSAAIYVTRARRSVCVIDTGAPRNRFAAASHGFFGQDGIQFRCDDRDGSLPTRRLPAAADGVTAGVSLHRSLVFGSLAA